MQILPLGQPTNACGHTAMDGVGMPCARSLSHSSARTSSGRSTWTSFDSLGVCDTVVCPIRPTIGQFEKSTST